MGDHGHGHQHGHSHGHGHGHDPDALPELLELDAEVLHEYRDGLIEQVADLTGGAPRRILDLGCGNGTGTLALAARFPEAELIAVDVSPDMLRLLGDKAARAGVAGRVRTVQADLDDGWPDVAGVDLVWASASMHHVADPDRVLADLFAAIRPGGLLAVAEVASHPRFLPDGVGGGGEARLHAALAERQAAEMPHRGEDWGPRLAKAGFAVESARHAGIELTAPLPDATGRYARATLARMRSGLREQLSAEDHATLHALLDGDGPESVLRRDDLTVRAERSAWLCRRP
ncbi:class I SAM-dependent methyltransferase [Actinoplanes sp. NPDC049668]|uniref:class I SAM-dependent methyltransferase n=1 Tax=unclassified Actinoplanes TaxID=2626549 RepID=UPI0033B3F4A7